MDTGALRGVWFTQTCFLLNVGVILGLRDNAGDNPSVSIAWSFTEPGPALTGECVPAQHSSLQEPFQNGA